MRLSFMRPAAAIASLSLVSACVAGCAQHSSEIPAQYTSPVQYETLSCKQIGAEMATVSARVSELAAQNDKVAGDDEAVMGVGLVLFWPALFFLDKNTTQAAEYGRLKGEFDALEQAGIHKNCGLHVQRPKAPKPQAHHDDEDQDYPDDSAYPRTTKHGG